MNENMMTHALCGRFVHLTKFNLFIFEVNNGVAFYLNKDEVETTTKTYNIYDENAVFVGSIDSIPASWALLPMNDVETSSPCVYFFHVNETTIIKYDTLHQTIVHTTPPILSQGEEWEYFEQIDQTRIVVRVKNEKWIVYDAMHNSIVCVIRGSALLCEYFVASTANRLIMRTRGCGLLAVWEFANIDTLGQPHYYIVIPEDNEGTKRYPLFFTANLAAPLIVCTESGVSVFDVMTPHNHLIALIHVYETKNVRQKPPTPLVTRDLIFFFAHVAMKNSTFD